MNAMHSQVGESRLLRLAWGVVSPTSRGPRARYVLSEVIEAAVSLADQEGLAAVSLGALAAELELTTTALYRYVDSKETLVHLMVDAAVGDPPELGAADWRSNVQRWAGALWGRYTAHPWLAHVQPAGMPRYPHQLAWMDVLLGELDSGPLSDPLHTALLLDGLARSFGLLMAGASEGAATPDWLREAIAARYPRLARELERDWIDIAEEFTTAVETVLRGAETRSWR